MTHIGRCPFLPPVPNLLRPEIVENGKGQQEKHRGDQTKRLAAI
jgi:hypothetical protein